MCVCDFRDKKEPLKKLTDEERRQITLESDSGSSSGYGSMSYSSPRRERGVRIYVEPSPKEASAFDQMN